MLFNCPTFLIPTVVLNSLCPEHMKNNSSHKKYLGFIIFLIFAAGLSVKEGLGGGDFDVYLDASRRLFAGENIYAPPHFNNLQYYYSPLLQ